MSTLEEVSARIIEAGERKVLRARLEADIAEAEITLQQKKRNRVELEQRFVAEQLDVERLKGLSIRGMVLGLRGEKEERRQAEEREALAAKLEHDRCRQEIRALESRLEAMRIELRRLGDPDAYEEMALAEKERLLVDAGSGDAGRLAELSGQAATLRAQLTDLGEAATAGSALTVAFAGSLQALKSARNWGRWDTYGGGGMLSTAMKHSRLSEASAMGTQMHELIHRFRKELADVGVTGPVAVQIGEFAGVGDFLFDGFFFDAMVQTKIVGAQERVEAAIANIDRIVDDLAARAETVSAQLEAVESERRALLGAT